MAWGNMRRQATMKRVCAGRSGGFTHGAAKCRKRENTPNGVGMVRSKVALNKAAPSSREALLPYSGFFAT